MSKASKIALACLLCAAVVIAIALTARWLLS
jgi:hypothetical protein